MYNNEKKNKFLVYINSQPSQVRSRFGHIYTTTIKKTTGTLKNTITSKNIAGARRDGRAQSLQQNGSRTVSLVCVCVHMAGSSKNVFGTFFSTTLEGTLSDVLITK